MQWLSSRPPGRSRVAQRAEVGGQLGVADVLGEPDRADRVELATPGRRGSRGDAPRPGLCSPRRTISACAHSAWLRDSVTPSALHPVLGGGVHDHAAPAAADVEQPHPRFEGQLLRDQLVLGRLRLLQRGRLGRVHRAGVGHRRAEHPLVEPVGHVVVVRDGLAVARLRVQPARRAVLQLGRRRPVPQPQRQQPAGQPELLGPRHVVQRDVGHRVQQLVEVAVDLDLALDVARARPSVPGAVASRASARGEVIRIAMSELSGPALLPS